ncbi:DUF4421 family protein [Algoriphagus pacificus]|uniref:DUF4421 family protein n=1 Tax=Algoriphagus pacificus TaxID=2811234 RepID=A0ABS3CEX0_9BACT|nr:DUF4421 family protein [Algoriphagus pacificus]MBN7815653.1 DUF4421 family protein [Algoriphagus pacificus]
MRLFSFFLLALFFITSLGFSQQFQLTEDNVSIPSESKNTPRLQKELASRLTDQYSSKLAKPAIQVSENDTIPSSEGIIIEDGYIENMSNYLAFRVSLVNDNERFSVESGPSITKIYPNGSSVLKLNMNYRFLSLGFSFIPKFITGNDDNLTKGETTGIGFSTGFNFTHWVQELSYTRTTGYYLDNTSDFDSDWMEGDPYVQFPNLHYRSIQGVTGYNFNQHFSTKAIFTGTERQLKSAGTFLPTLLYRYYIVDNREEPTGTITTQKSKNFEVIANAGYYYTHVIQEKFYASAGASLGYGFLNSKVITRFVGDQVEVKQNNGVFKWDARGALGYNGERFFSGMLITAENRKFKQQNTSVINADWRVYLQMHVGYRLFAPKKLRNTVDAIPILN